MLQYADRDSGDPAEPKGGFHDSLALQEQLTSTEERVANSRQFYNDSVLTYNTRIQTFPRTLVAGPLHFTTRQFFDAEPEAAEPVTVQF